MSTAAPHRGSRAETLVHGRCALAGIIGDGAEDAGVATLGGVGAAFTGTLDNARELAKDLDLGGVPATPAAVVAAGFAAWGERLAPRMRGVFAVALTDGERLVCFRDHIGFGPLFYRRDGSGFYAASEPKQVLAGAGIAREPDLEVLEGTFFQIYGDEMPSALRGVSRLPKGTLLTTAGGAVQLTRYWNPESLLETANYSEAELHDRFTELMDRAVARCLTGHDAIMLSGGIDSPAVAAFAAPRHLDLSGRPLFAISAVYPRFASVDERRYTELVATRLGIPLHTWQPQTNPLEGLEDWVAFADGPVVAGSLALYAEAYRVARELGPRNVLTGEFAEFACGLDDFLIDHLLSHGRLRAAARQLSMRRSGGASWIGLARELAAALSPAPLRAARMRQTQGGVPAWVDLKKARDAAAESLVGPRRRWAKLQLSPFVGSGASVEAEEVCQAVCGVRARRPFADVDLWEFFLSLRSEVKFPDTRGKRLLIKLLRGRVPDEILDRTDKTVFDDAMLANVDYATLRRLLVDPGYQIDGVDYELLGERLRGEKLGIVDYIWVMRLAAVHAFLSHEGAAAETEVTRV